jgi:hypothetical protein
VGGLALFGTAYTAYLTSRATFATKAAEIIFASPTAEEAAVKAGALQQLFPWYMEQARVDLVGGMSPLQPQLRKDLIQLLAEKPDKREAILKDWQAVYPAADYVVKMLPAASSASSGTQRSKP